MEKHKPKFHSLHHINAITFLVISIITTGTLSVFKIVLFDQSHTAMAQQQQQQQGWQPQPNGNSFQIDDMSFSHNTISVNGIQLHYVIGGHGPPVVLIHGWPETWYEWRHVMPSMAKNYTVIAPDLRGLGDSSKPLTGYDGKTTAEDIHQLVAQLGFKQIFLVGHDVGSQPAYSYAAAHPTEVKRLVIMEYLFPGFTPPQLEGKIWWFPFHQTPDIPEALVDGKERIYLSWFYHNIAYNPAAITQADIDEFVNHYSAPGGMRDGFNYFRAFPEDAIQNMNYSKTKLTMPVLAVGGGYIPAFGGDVTINYALYGMQKLAQDVKGVKVPLSGHWIPEERPEFVVNMLNNFFGGANAK
jgi:pimeloyl-ACP methyl ester carboxylesterase